MPAWTSVHQLVFRDCLDPWILTEAPPDLDEPADRARFFEQQSLVAERRNLVLERVHGWWRALYLLIAGLFLARFALTHSLAVSGYGGYALALHLAVLLFSWPWFGMYLLLPLLWLLGLAARALARPVL